MKRHPFALVLAVGALMLPGSALAKIGDEPPPDPEPSGGQTTQIGNALQWELRSPAAQISAGVPFSLRTTTSNQYLAFGQQRFGINLSYYAAERRNFTLTRQTGANGPIKLGERLALREQDGGYLGHMSREYGINLGYFNTPHFEWELRGTSPEIRTSSPTLGLFNGSRGDYLVRASRPGGVNLRWLGDTQ